MVALIVGCSIGLVLGLTGAGGSVLAVPLLVFVLGFSPESAVTASLATVFVSALIGVAARLKYQETVWIPAISFAVGGMAFAPLGVYLAGFFSPHWHLGTFIILMFVIAARMLWQSVHDPEIALYVRAETDGSGEFSAPMCPLSENNQFQPRIRCISMLGLGGALTGILSGIYGVGGGFLIVPFMTAITQLSMRQAVGTSLFVITVISGVGFFSYILKAGGLSIATSPALVVVIGGAIVGMLVGTLLSRKIAGPRLQQLFVVAIIVMAIFSLVNLNSLP